MINFTELDFTTKLGVLPQELQDKLLLLRFDGKFLSIINYKTSKSQEVINNIDYATRITALGFASKQEMFNLIKDVILDEEETRHIFGEIDSTILVPNNLQGAPEEIVREDHDGTEEGGDVEALKNVEPKNTEVADKYSDSNITETAEDILKEIENPTSSPLIFPIIKPSFSTAPNVVTPIEIPKIESKTEAKIALPTSDTITPTSLVMPSNKESQLNSKLTEPVVQTAKSTYYKVDPYREQM